MEDFANYILQEESLIEKMDIVYYLSKKGKIFFDKSVIFKTEIAKMFLNYIDIDVDTNLVLTACLLCNCKKVGNAPTMEELNSYAKNGAKYLENLGFEKRFCKICEEMNRYSNSNPREKESDILELADQFGGMLLNRKERIGFKPDEALVLLEYRNLKDVYNRYLGSFIDFVKEIEQLQIDKISEATVISELIKIYNNTPNLIEFMKKMEYEYAPNVNKLIEENREKIKGNIFQKCKENPNIPLFSESTTKKIMKKIENEKLLKKVSEE